jgi:prepilin-type N-terminal cleavage/methylation domain-containing protein
MRRGFTLLEVMVSLSILALAMVTIAGVNATAFESSNYAKYITVATLLGRGKMLDVEEQLRKDGFGDLDKEYDGDFSAEGHPNITWRAACREVEVDVNQLLAGLFGGEVQTDALPGQIQDFLGAMRGEGSDQLVDSVAGSDLSKVMGGGGLELILKQVGDTLSKSIREITLEITWKDGPYNESVKFVQYVTTSGRLSVPNAPATLVGGGVGNQTAGPSEAQKAAGFGNLPGGLPPFLGGGLPGGLGGGLPGAGGGKSTGGVK